MKQVGPDNWFEFVSSVYPVRVMFFIGSREEMCGTFLGGMSHCKDRPSSEFACNMKHGFEQNFGQTNPGVCAECLYYVAEDGSRMWVVRMDNFDGSMDDTAVLSHECLHAALSVLDYCNLRENPPYEALCYLHEAMFKQFATDAFARVGMLMKEEDLAKRGIKVQKKEKGAKS